MQAEIEGDEEMARRGGAMPRSANHDDAHFLYHQRVAVAEENSCGNSNTSRTLVSSIRPFVALISFKVSP